MHTLGRVAALHDEFANGTRTTAGTERGGSNAVPPLLLQQQQVPHAQQVPRSTFVGNSSKAAIYRTRAARIIAELQSNYWTGATADDNGYFITNKLDLFKNEGVWFDDQVWALYFNLATPLQASSLFAKLGSTSGGQYQKQYHPVALVKLWGPDGGAYAHSTTSVPS